MNQARVTRPRPHPRNRRAARGRCSPPARSLALTAALALAGFLRASAQDDPWSEISAGGLASFRQPTGEWKDAAAVTVHKDNPKLLQWSEGRGIIVNGPSGRTQNLLTAIEHGDAEVHIEFMVPQGSNSGVYFMGRYEIQVFDSWGRENPAHSDCGGIYQRWDDKRRPQGFEGRPPRVNASKKPGEWQSYEVIFRAPRFDAEGRKTHNAVFVKVVHNGVLIHENQEVSGPTRASTYNDEKPAGPLMLQGDHGPVAYRNIRIKNCGPPPR
jgi:hypothetical protein